MHYKVHGQDWTCSVTEMKIEFPAVAKTIGPILTYRIRHFSLKIYYAKYLRVTKEKECQILENYRGVELPLWLLATESMASSRAVSVLKF